AETPTASTGVPHAGGVDSIWKLGATAADALEQNASTAPANGRTRVARWAVAVRPKTIAYPPSSEPVRLRRHIYRSSTTQAGGTRPLPHPLGPGPMLQLGRSSPSPFAASARSRVGGLKHGPRASLGLGSAFSEPAGVTSRASRSIRGGTGENAASRHECGFRPAGSGEGASAAALRGCPE